MNKILLACLISLMVSSCLASPSADTENETPTVGVPVIPDNGVVDSTITISCGPAEEVINEVKNGYGDDIFFMSLSPDKSTLTEMFFNPQRETWAIVTLKKLKDDPKACLITHGDGLSVNPLYKQLLSSSVSI